MVSCSARVNIYNKGSDSLLGLYFHFRMHPFSLRELSFDEPLPPDDFFMALRERAIGFKKEFLENLAVLTKFGGFPNPCSGRMEKKPGYGAGAECASDNRVRRIDRS